MSTAPDASGPAHRDRSPAHHPRNAPGRWGLLPSRWRMRRSPKWWQEIAFIVISYLLYSRVRNTVGGTVAADCRLTGTLSPLQRIACGRALDLWHFERAIGTGFELGFNKALARVPWLASLANYWYAIAHFVVAVGVLIWIYRRHPLQYRGLRTVLYSTNLMALFGYAFYELAPPRMLTQVGFVDTVVKFHTWGSWGSGGVASVSNQFAAMPSMHVGWSVWSAIALAQLSSKNWVKVLGCLYPVVTFFVIVGTANHFWLDALGGLIALWLGFLIQRVLSGQPAVDMQLEHQEQSATAL
ncbi:MAG: phosphatase PAP2 family protein [Actinomycetota bacterium]